MGDPAYAVNPVDSDYEPGQELILHPALGVTILILPLLFLSTSVIILFIIWSPDEVPTVKRNETR